MSNTSAKILDGRVAREELKKALIERVKGLSVKPQLVIIQVGTRGDSAVYISAKKKFAMEIGVKENHVELPETVTQEELLAIVGNYNADPAVQGIIVQMPLPLGIDPDVVFDAITPEKDVDGLSSVNVKKWLAGRADAVVPATARGIVELLDFYNIPLEGKKVVVVGRSMLVGKSVAALCTARNATVTLCHSKTLRLEEETRRAAVLIVAVGHPKAVGAAHLSPGQVVIDVGTTPLDGKLTGDVDFEAAKDIVAAITPVPGGVGQMTVLALFENLVDSCYNKGLTE